MVELAIALSLQDQGDGGVLQQGLQNLQQGLQGLQQLANLGQGLAGILGGRAEQDDSDGEGEGEVVAVVDDNGHYSDTTASAPGSDDEGSLGVGGQPGDGDMEHESEEQEVVGGSDSGGSIGESIGAENLPVSGRSSAGVEMVEVKKEEMVMMDTETDTDTDVRLGGLRQVMIEKLVENLVKLREVGGARCIPYMQIALAMAVDLDPGDTRDQAALASLLNKLVSELGVGASEEQDRNLAEMSTRTLFREFQLVILRLLSVLMSRTRASSTPSQSTSESINFVSKTTAASLAQSGLVSHHLKMLKSIVTYWQSLPQDDGMVLPGCKLLRPAASNHPPDMAPFFLKQYVKSHAYDVFEAYPQLLTEMALRIPYQMKKIADSASEPGPVPHFDQSWFYQLCELMITPQAPFVKRQVRKLLLLICGSKEQYRQLRDLHTLETRIKEVKITVAKGGFDVSDLENSSVNLMYDTLIQLIEQLKICVEVAESRTLNWQRFCMGDETVLPFLLQVSYMLDNGVTPLVLQLLQTALCPPSKAEKPTRSKSSSPDKAVRKEKQRSEEPDDEVNCASDENLCIALVQQLSRMLTPSPGSASVLPVLERFIEKFLLECNTTSVRWQAHALIVSLYNNSALEQRQCLLSILWSLWRRLPEHGRRASQFVDLLGYFSVGECRAGNEDKISQYAGAAVDMLRTQNKILSSHANSAIYTSLSQLVDFTGYYLESDPCLVCNNPEVSFSNLKLSSLKVDTKFTTSSQMVKLSGSHSISKILLRIGDLKRQKMVRTINIYYNNRTVQAVVELKNKPTMWHLAKKITLTSGQVDLKVEFPLPIVACNIMIEYSDFFENMQAVGESLQCPRCSASVPANPGVCSNCGENVYQCHKCRAINYDEKDPFLCNSCGFCKYAKFEYSLTARPCCAVDPTENEEDRKKALANINNLLEKADKVYRQLIANKPELEHLLIRVSDGTDMSEEVSGSGNPVNKFIHQLGQKYCVECKNLFEDLSKLIQKVMATRLELITFDRSRATGAREPSAGPQLERKLSCVGGMRMGPGQNVTCYGCATACVEHCLTLLRALATRQVTRPELHTQDLVTELLHSNLRRGVGGSRASVQALICLLTRNNADATEKLNRLLFSRLLGALNSGDQILAPVRHDMNLMAALVKQKDSCWETRLKTVVRLFLAAARHGTSPAIMDSFTLPCLNILQDMVRTGGNLPGPPPAAPRKKDKEKSGSPEADDRSGLVRPSVDIRAWLREEFSFAEWAHSFDVANGKRTIGKYFARWRNNVAEKKWIQAYGGLDVLKDECYLKQILFNRSCRSGRQVSANLVQYFIENGPLEVRKSMIDSLTAFLGEVGDAGEASEEFMELYQRLLTTGDWRYYLAVRGVPGTVARLITKEIAMFSHLEQTRLSSDLALGYAVKQLTQLLSGLLHHAKIRALYKSRLVSDVLGGYLSLRRLVVQRTKMIDETQDNLLELLEDLTTGTDEETKSFMAVCIETVGKYPPDDQLTPTFIFERLCSIIFPEESDTGEFYLTLEKDPQQEEFLQGRMLGNPYSSKEPGLGPLMREVKNKICTDCELVALLEDDNGMELLVNNKIISLDLPVKDVYTKVWLTEAGEGEPMRVVYRMRGLLGDATEEFIESLNKKDGEKSDDEVTYKLASVMGECGGLAVILKKLSGITNLSNMTLLNVLLKLFGYCCKVKYNRDLLLAPGLNVTGTLLGALKLCLSAGESQAGTSLTETVLQLMEALLVEAAASHKSLEQYQAFAGAASATDIQDLLEHAVHMKPGTDLHHHLMRVLPFLAYANRDNMELVINHFNPVLNFAQFDGGHTSEDEARLEAWVALCVGIERNILGNTMKDELVRLGIITQCTDYITQNSPPLSTKQILLRTDDPGWKEFAMKPSIKYILRCLAGLAAEHDKTQVMIADTVISQLHLMEQMSSDEHLGSMAEAVLEALKGHREAGAKVKAVRSATREEKKKMAMAMRAKQLKAIGLKTNDKGQVKADANTLKQFEPIAEETGLVCVICREGYKFQPNKVLAIYTFTKRTTLEEAEQATRKTLGYSTVSHFNLVHVDCHLAAVRQARARDEWESAALQNANTKCNGLLPLWGPGIAESAYAACLARHNTYLAEVTGQRDISYKSTVHDIKIMLSKFAQEKSFSEDSGGGGPQSNLNTLPYLAHMALYVINTTRAASRELTSVRTWLSAPPSQWVEQATAADGPLYSTALCSLLMTPAEWSEKRAAIFQRLMATVHIRAGAPVNKKAMMEYSAYRPLVLFWAMVDLVIRQMWAGVTVGPDQEWSQALAEWIRKNDEAMLARSQKILAQFQEELVPAEGEI